MNKQIENLIREQNYEKALCEIEQYEIRNKKDVDINTYKFLCYCGLEEFSKCLDHAIASVKSQPYDADVHYNCGYAFEVNGFLYESYEQYMVASEIILAGNNGNVILEQVLENAQMVLDKIVDLTQNDGIRRNEVERHCLDYLVNKNKYKFGVRYPEFHAEFDVIGSDYYDYSLLDRMFIGICDLKSAYSLYCENLKANTVDERAEMQRTSAPIKWAEIDCKKESYVPIVTNTRCAISFELEQINRNVEVIYNSPLQYVNYRVPKGKVRIASENAFRLGEVIPIGHDASRKRLVLNIFVDGLSQTVLDDSFKTLMPHTYKYFKYGMKCSNAHTAGDWTFPSIASITTGQTLPEHKMLHSKISKKLDVDTPILFEYFKNAGYNTTKIGGNWRIAPNYGYARGMNRVKYQHMYMGYSVEQVIADVEEQMHSMADTDQFIWMEIGELHLVADEINMAPLQSEFMIWENEQYSGKINSVKQKYDETKIKYYKKQIEYIDRRLASLYQYIEENYDPNDVVVSLFADHGQGYLIKPEEDFLSNERTNIAFMFKNGELEGETDEIISACDYSGILCKLAGIDYNYAGTDANLPLSFGGTSEREFCVTESIHVGDPYEIVLNGKNFKFYLKGRQNVTAECRVPLDEYDVLLVDEQGQTIEDENKIKYYTEWCLNHIGTCRIFNN